MYINSKKRMHPIVRNILAVALGAVVGAIVNSSIISYGALFLPGPEGIDPNDLEALKASMATWDWTYFMKPFLAHALGTLVGAFVAVKIAISNHLTIGLIVGAFFFIGGAMMVYMLPAPMWFNALDLIVAYLPMGWLGYTLAKPKNA